MEMVVGFFFSLNGGKFSVFPFRDIWREVLGKVDGTFGISSGEVTGGGTCTVSRGFLAYLMSLPVPFLECFLSVIPRLRKTLLLHILLLSLLCDRIRLLVVLSGRMRPETGDLTYMRARQLPHAHAHVTRFTNGTEMSVNLEVRI